MPDRRKHRSADPADRRAFHAGQLPRLRAATEDLSWLLGRGYGERAALVLVGDRHELTARQREAVARCACADEMLHGLARRRLPTDALRTKQVAIDGFNVLVTLEIALGGGVVLLARDGCARDVGGVRGTWRRTVESRPALELVGRRLEAEDAAACTWVLDRSVSNVGRLRGLLVEVAEANGWRWSADTVADADSRLVELGDVVASADREVLRRCGPWTSLAREAIETQVPQAWLVDLSGRG